MQLPWISEAEKVIGLHEVRDLAKLSAWLKSDGATLGNPSKMPWCGDFVDTALERALPKEPRPGALKVNPYWARNWTLFGVESAPVYGSVAVFVRNGGGHVGFLVGESDGHYLVLGGNQSNRVSKAWIAKTRCIGTRWPSLVSNPQIKLPRVPMSGKVSTNES